MIHTPICCAAKHPTTERVQLLMIHPIGREPDLNNATAQGLRWLHRLEDRVYAFTPAIEARRNAKARWYRAEHQTLLFKHPGQCIAQLVPRALSNHIINLFAIAPQHLDLVLADESWIDGDIELMP